MCWDSSRCHGDRHRCALLPAPPAQRLPGVCTRRRMLRTWGRLGEGSESGLREQSWSLGSIYSDKCGSSCSERKSWLRTPLRLRWPGQERAGAWKWELNRPTPECFLVNSGFSRTTEQACNRVSAASTAGTCPGAAAQPAPRRESLRAARVIAAFPSGSLIPRSAAVPQRKHESESPLINLPDPAESPCISKCFVLFVSTANMKTSYRARHLHPWWCQPGAGCSERGQGKPGAGQALMGHWHLV